jgi:hypothetical protein
MAPSPFHMLQGLGCHRTQLRGILLLSLKALHSLLFALFFL